MNQECPRSAAVLIRITSTITVGCSTNKRQADNSRLSPDKYEILDMLGSPRHPRRYPAFFSMPRVSSVVFRGDSWPYSLMLPPPTWNHSWTRGRPASLFNYTLSQCRDSRAKGCSLVIRWAMARVGTGDSVFLNLADGCKSERAARIDDFDRKRPM